MPDYTNPDAAASGATPPGGQEPTAVRPPGAGDSVLPSGAEPTPHSQAPMITAEMPVVAVPEAPAPLEPEPLRQRGRRARVRPIIEWRSYSGWFTLLWLLDVGWLAYAALHGAGPVTEFPKVFVGKALGGAFLAVVLAFVVPVAMLDDSSHHTRAWWVAWLWPPVLVLMLAADAMVIGALAMRLMPLVSMLKKH